MIAIFNKKLLIPAGLFVAGFLVINVGMFFFLKATQPKVGGRVETQATPAPAAVAKTDSSASAAPQLASADTAVHADSLMPVPVETTAVSQVADEMTAAAVDTPVVEPEAEVSQAPAEPSADEVAQALQSGDARQTVKLAKLLESMKPVEAADIVSHLTTDQIVALVMKMKDRTAGRMLAALPIEQAAQVAERMSQTASRSRGG
jgi:hypothetical protein